MAKSKKDNTVENIVVETKSVGNPVLSSRIDPEIHSSFETICDRLKIKKSVVIQELLKDFIVRNAEKESHENAEIVLPKIKEGY